MKRTMMNKKREKEKISLNIMGAVGERLKREFKELRGRGARFFSQKIKIFWEESAGQSLMEIVIALAIGAILIGGASTAIVVVLQSGKTSQIQQSATTLAQKIIEESRIYGMADWSNLYGLSKTSSTKYFFNTSSTELFHVEGTEGVVDGDIRSGLVGHWKLDEATSTTAYDYSGSGNNGVTTEAVATSTDHCKVGRCYSFDGTDDYVGISDDNILDITDAITLAAWIKAEASQLEVAAGIVTKWNTKAWNLHLSSSAGWAARMRLMGLSGTDKVDGTTDLTDNAWHHVVGTWDGSTLRIYVDGVEENSESGSGSIDTTSDDVQIGNFQNTNYPFNGYIDDVRVYNRVLSADEIEHLYNSTLFNRYFYVENACRTNDANYDLAGAAPCDSGEVDDPSTQLVTGVLEWSGKEGESNFSLSEYVTRWQNEVFHQTDWSGGSGQEGPVSDSTNRYSSSTDVNISNLGEIRIEGL